MTTQDQDELARRHARKMHVQLWADQERHDERERHYREQYRYKVLQAAEAFRSAMAEAEHCLSAQLCDLNINRNVEDVDPKNYL